MPFPDVLLRTLDAPAGSPSAGLFSSLPLLLMMVGVFYFLVIRPQQKEAQEHQKLVAGLQKGDRVVTTGGIHGRIHEARADAIVLEVSPNSYLTVDRDVVKRKVTEPAKDGAAVAKGA